MHIPVTTLRHDASLSLYQLQGAPIVIRKLKLALIPLRTPNAALMQGRNGDKCQQ